MKCVLRDRIFIEVDEKLKNLIEKELTYTIPLKVGAFEVRYVKLYDFKRVNSRTLSIPIGRTDLIPDTHNIIDKRIYNMVDYHISNNITLRPSQQLVYNQVVDNCIVNAGCGEGKTITALALVEKLGQKTIIIVHTKKLLEQWVIEINNVLGLKPGIIGAGLFEVDNAIVIATKQTLDSKADAKLYNEFGLVILDECHHAPAKSFNAILDKFRARYKIGLTATLRRKDQKQFLITNYLSHSNVIKMDSGHTLIPKVIGIHSGITLPGAASWQGRVTKLMDNNDYVSLIIQIIINQVNKGHKVLCLGGRLTILQQLNRNIDNSELVIGGSTNTDEVIKRVYSGETTCIIGSTQVMSEGISINPLSCLIYATPFSSDIIIEQTVGRIIRQHDGKLEPVVFDIILKGQTGASQWRERKKYYESKNYIIKEITI